MPTSENKERKSEQTYRMAFALSLFHSLELVISTEQILALVEQLEQKVERLNRAYVDAKKEIKLLEIENADLSKSLKEKQNELRQLRKKPVSSEKNTPKSKDIGIIVKDNLLKTDTNAELKQQLDEYIRELERCIAHLSSLS